MPDMNIRQLRNTRRLKAWLRAGKTVQLRERNCVIARIVPETLPTQPRTWPDFASRMKRRLRAGAKITELDGSHVIMVSQPEAVTNVILEAVAAVTGVPVGG